MQLHLDRTMPISLASQIKGRITYAISYGQLKAGQALPSVRELSATLGVAPVTISQVYRELAQQGLVISKRGAGTFVADIEQADPGVTLQASRDTLQQLADTYVGQAVSLGYRRNEIEATTLASLGRYMLEGPMAQRSCVLMVGNFLPATVSYASEIEELWRDLNVAVIPILLEQLQSNLGSLQDALACARLAIVVPPRLNAVRAILEPKFCRVAAVAFSVNADTRRRLAGIQPTQRVGIVSTYPEFLQTITDDVMAYSLAKAPPLSALLGDDERINSMLRQIDVLVYASGSEAICNLLPAEVEPIELRHSPEPDSVNRLRPLLALRSVPREVTRDESVT